MEVAPWKMRKQPSLLVYIIQDRERFLLIAWMRDPRTDPRGISLCIHGAVYDPFPLANKRCRSGTIRSRNRSRHGDWQLVDPRRVARCPHLELRVPVPLLQHTGARRHHGARGSAAFRSGPSTAERYLPVLAEHKTTGEFRKVAEIADDEINAAVDAVLAQPHTGSYPIGGGYLLDLVAAVGPHEPSAKP